MPQLWAKGEGSFVTEMTGGRWITYVAEMQSGQKAIGAYRSVNCEAVPTAPPIPGIPGIPPPPPPPMAPAGDQALINSAIAMNEGLKVRGYKQADMRVYKDFQAKAKLTPVDGYPGTNTMLKLELTLKNAGQQMAPVKVYPWKATGAYDGVNAPTSAEWYGSAVPKTSPIIPPPAPTVSPPPGAPPSPAPVIVPAAYVTPSPVNPPATATALDAAKAMNGMLMVHGYKQADMALYKAFQSKAGLSPADGFPGIGTMGKLELVLKSAGLTIAPVKVYPWRSTGGYDGVNAPTAAEWYGTGAPAPATSPIIPATYVQAPTASMQAAPPGASALQSAAVAMNNALIAHGYRQYDQVIYKAFQKAAGYATQDGFPGSGTMGKLQSALATMGLPLASVPIYPWKASGAYDGVNAPLSSDWYAPRGIAA
jgi:hypothetical protein